MSDTENKVKELEEEYENFVKGHYKGHFAQSLKWARTKTEWKHEIVVVRGEDGKGFRGFKI